MAAPVDRTLPTSPVRTSGSRPEDVAPRKPQPGELPFTRAAAPEPPVAPASPGNGEEPVNVDVNGFPTHLLFKTSGGQEIKIRRASQIEQPAPPPVQAQPLAGGDEPKQA